VINEPAASVKTPWRVVHGTIRLGRDRTEFVCARSTRCGEGRKPLSPVFWFSTRGGAGVFFDMRPLRLFLYTLFIAALVAPTSHVFAQPGGGGRGGGQGQSTDDEDEAAKKKRDEEWSTGANLDLPGPKNSGPCPFVKVLYDASRYVELKDNRESAAAVGYTGEIQTLTSACAYKGDEPIHIKMQILFALGRGPEATGAQKTYRYWVAVTDRNVSVLDKQYFDLPVTFPAGKDRVLMTDTLNDIWIPRADNQVSGSNFEVLVGFDVDPKMADFNRQGKRFLANAGASASPPPPQ